MPGRWISESVVDHVALCPAPKDEFVVGFAIAWYDEDAKLQSDSWTCPVVAWESVSTHDYSKHSLAEDCFHPQRTHELWEGCGWGYDGNFLNRGAIYVGDCGRLCSTIQNDIETDGPVYKIFRNYSPDTQKIMEDLVAEAVSHRTYKKNKEELNIL